jgi:competence protein ComEC
MQILGALRSTYVVHALSVFVIAGAAVYSLTAPLTATPELDTAVGQRVTILGTVVQEPDVREKFIQLTTETEVGTVLVRTDRFTTVAYGDVIRATGKLVKPESFETDTGHVFNYPMYLYAHGVTHVMSFANVVVEEHGKGNWVIAELLALKHWFIAGIEKALPEPESALLAGLLVGEKRGLGEDLTESFRAAGVIHIMVLSGYNVALVINTVRAGLQQVLPRAVALGSAGVVAILFMLMTGASETAIRATLMALVVLLANALHRPADGVRILLVVAAAMAVWNPYVVLFDLSYQLSVLATLGLVMLSHHLVPYLLWLRSKSLIEIVSTTLATQIAVLPLLVFSVGQVSLISLITNVLVLAFVPYAMLAGFCAALLASVSTTLAFPLSAVAYALLRYIIEVAVFLGSVPYAAVNL